MKNIIIPIAIGIFGFALNAQSNIEKMKDYIAGSQLVVYSESSYLSDNSASAITYIDFCASGAFYYNYNGSYTVKGTQNTSNRDSRVYGAGNASNSGNWNVIKYQDMFYLEITDLLGKITYYPIDLQKMIAGKWKQSNLTYVFAPNNGVCQ